MTAKFTPGPTVKNKCPQCSDVRSELEALKHDIGRHVAICAEQANEIHRLNNPKVSAGKKSGALRRRISELEAKVDWLMLEYCPEEMTDEQRANWAKHQVTVDNASEKATS